MILARIEKPLNRWCLLADGHFEARVGSLREAAEQAKIASQSEFSSPQPHLHDQETSMTSPSSSLQDTMQV